MSDIYANAVDSLRIGIEHFLKEPGYSSRKHAILTLFHAIELFLKEQLHRTNPILIYRNLDTKITEDSLTVGIKEARKSWIRPSKATTRSHRTNSKAKKPH
jgi:hypothetical protein